MKRILIFILLLGLGTAAPAPLTDLDNPFSSPRAAALGLAGAADDSREDIFISQFGLAGLSSAGFYFSGYRSLADVNFLNAAFYFPVGPLGLGVGYRLKTVDGVLLSPPDLMAAGSPAWERVDYLNYQQSALYLAAGLPLGLFDLGLAVKNYTVPGNPAWPELGARGSNLDIGLRARLTGVWSLSLQGRNVLAGQAAGGALLWNTGTAEAMLNSVALGNKFSFNDGRLVYLVDVTKYAEDYYPVLWNAGAEFVLNEYLTLRGGVRQYAEQPSKAGVLFNAVSGGLRLTPWRGVYLDYAYYPGDNLALETLHYTGLALDFGELQASFPPRAVPEQPDEPPAATENNAADFAALETGWRLLEPKEIFTVSDLPEQTISLQSAGYRSITINGLTQELRDGENKIPRPLEPGNNLILLEADGRQIKRHVLRLRSLAELSAVRQEKDLVQLVFTPERRLLDAADGAAKISLAEFAGYLNQSLNLRLPADFAGVFDNLDILYFNGLLGGAAEGVVDAGPGYFSVSRLAEILARLDGYSEALDTAENPREKAVEILTATGYYTAADFFPPNTEVTLAKAQSLFMRTAFAHKRLAAEFGDYPLVWLDIADLERGRLTLRFHNAERFDRYSWTCGRQTVSGKVAGKDSIALAPDVRENNVVFVEVFDRAGRAWHFSAAAGLDGEPLFLARTEPARLEAGMRARVSFAAPENLTLDSVALRIGDSAKTLPLRRQSNGLWAGMLTVPDTVRTGEYIFTFLANIAGQIYEKKIPVPVRGFERSVVQKPAPKGQRVLTRTSAPSVPAGEPFYIYAGLSGGGQLKEMRIVFPDESYLVAEPYGERLWRTALSSAIAGRNEYKAVAIFADGAAAEQSGSFYIGTNAPQAVLPAKSAEVAQPVKPPRDKNQPRLNKVYYPVEIMLSPAKPKPAGTLTIKAKYAAPLRKVYARIGDKHLPLKQNGAIWQTQYVLPAQSQTLYIQIYAEDARGNLSMTEKVLKY
jgi:hypothetical protein